MPWSTSRPKGSGTDAIYRTPEHRRMRARLLAELERNGTGRCCIGGEPIYFGQAVHADHCPTCRGHGCGSCGGVGYRGLACAAHNRSDGATRGRERQNSSPLRW